MSSEAPSPKDQTPFSSPLVESSLEPGVLFELEQDPSKIVRRESLAVILRRFNVLTHPDIVIQNEQQGLAKFVSTLMELKDYGIHLPHPRFVVGKQHSDEVALYTIVDRVEGERLHFITKDLALELYSELETLYAGLAKYLATKYATQDPYLHDIFQNDQYRYGVTVTDKTPQVYLVDVELLVENANTDVSHRSFSIYRVWELINSFRSMELLVGKQFVQARQTLKELVLAIPAEDRAENASALNRIKEALGASKTT